MPDEARSNVYKLSAPPGSARHHHRPGAAARILRRRARLTRRASHQDHARCRRIYNLLSQATGLGITQNIIDCYADIIRVWQPGDRIYLFGFSRGAYTVRCVGRRAEVLRRADGGAASKGTACGRCSAIASRRGASPPKRSKHVYQHGSSIKGDPLRLERERRAAEFRAQVLLRRRQGLQHRALLHRRVGHGATLGAGSFGLAMLAGPL